MADEDKFVGMYEFIEALKDLIKTADPTKREKLAQVLDQYCEDFTEDFVWALGAQSPALLHDLMITIDWSCRPEAQSKNCVAASVWLTENQKATLKDTCGS